MSQDPKGLFMKKDFGMTQRSILAGTNQTVIIKVGGSVTVKGQEGERILAEGTGGLTVDRRSESEIGRARAAIGEHVLFDVRIKLPNLQEKKTSDEVIEVQMGGSGEVLVPFESNVKVYAGKDIYVQAIKGQVDAFAGLNLKLQDVSRLGNASAGGSMDVDCQTMIGKDVTFGAGNDLRFHVSDLTSARLRVKDIGGYWEARIGEGEKSVTLKSGGDVTFVTDQNVEPLPPNYILGKIEKPST
jgi:hypothetical protein